MIDVDRMLNEFCLFFVLKDMTFRVFMAALQSSCCNGCLGT